jgi:outer membrane lipoprotein-sorting protein
MMRYVLKAGVFTLLMALAGTTATAQTLDEAKTALNEAFAKVETLTAQVVMNMSMGPGMSMKSTGSVALLREGDVVKYRQESKMSMEGAPAGVGDNTSISLYDGESMYLITDMMGRKTAIKSDPKKDGNLPAPGGQPLWDSLDKDYTLTRLDDEKIDGKVCYVLKGEPKEPELTGPSTFYFDQELGVLRRIEMKSPDIPGMSTINYSDFQVNAELDPGMFVFKKEEGMQVVDSGSYSPADVFSETAPAE